MPASDEYGGGSGAAEKRRGVGVLEPVQVVLRARRPPGRGDGLEVLLRPAGHAGRLQALAQQRAAAALGRADEIRGRDHGVYSIDPVGIVDISYSHRR
jgi:hypothetical protein